jgi:hypothetical protein
MTMPRRQARFFTPVVLLSTVAALGILTIVGLVTVGLGVALIAPVSTTFNVTATTERIDFHRAQPDPARWVLDDVDLHEDADERRGLSGSLEIAAPVRGFIERVGLGPLWAHLECEATCRSVGRLFNEADEPIGALGPRVDVFIGDLERRAADGRTVLLTLAGEVISGRSVGMEVGGTTAVLREGTVSLLDRSVFGNNIFESGRIVLSVGDLFLVSDPDPRAATLGFVLADERPALTAAYRIVGTRGSVVRPGGGTYDVSASLLGRLFHDDLFRATSAVLAVLATFSTIGALIVGVAQLAVSDKRRADPAPTDPDPSPGPGAATTAPTAAQPQPAATTDQVQQESEGAG